MSISSFLDTLLPRNCLLCGRRAHSALCPGCEADLPRLSGSVCPVCAAPLASAAPACGECLRSPPAYDATVAALRYAYPVDHLVQALKFTHRLAIADFFARCLLPSPAFMATAGAVIIPVPLSAQRLRERGFNQSVEIGRMLARDTGLPLDTNSLVRVQDTVPQSRLPWRARRGNVLHAFACGADFSGKPVIVLDDVMTTGATLDAIAKVLKNHGATRVSNWVVARAVKTLT